MWTSSASRRPALLLMLLQEHICMVAAWCVTIPLLLVTVSCAGAERSLLADALLIRTRTKVPLQVSRSMMVK